jgi:DNA-binding winged helix-turn-helix (wHTH) protein/Tol biopolymer transport system component
MLKSHRNLLEPLPSDRLRIGERIVDIPLREIASLTGGEPMRVTLKSLGVLLTLVAHAGRPVSREALLEWVWPDTLPTDDVVTQAVTQLRKALGDDRERPRYIETLAKQGYRLIAPVEWLVEAPRLEAPQLEAPRLEAPGVPVEAVASSAAKPGRARGLRIVAAVAVLALVATAAVWQWRGRSPAADASTPAVAAASNVATAPVPDYQRIASLPQAEERPSLSPDGAVVVYSRAAEQGSGTNLMLQTSAAVPPRALTEPVAKQFDVVPAWSPDGRQIAFVRSGGGRCLVMAIPAAGGAARELGECIGGEAHPVAWFPDGKALVGAGRTGGSSPASAAAGEKALYRMTLEDGRWERIDYPKTPADEDMAPAVSPDGRWIAFQRNVSLADLWRIPAGGGEAQRLTDLRTNIYGLAWTPDSRHLLFSRYIDGKVMLSTLALDTGRVTDHVGGDHSFLFPSVSIGSGAVAFEVELVRSRSRQVAVANDGNAMADSRVLFDTTGSNLMPAIAPDGRQLLFVSNRTGDLRLWWLDQKRPDTLRSFDGFMPMPRHPAMWRGDSQRALVIGRAGGEGHGEGSGLYELEPGRGRWTRLPVPDGQPVHAAYHTDPDRLLVVADRGEGRLGVTLYDRSREPWRALAQVVDVAVAVVDPRHRRIVLASMSTPDIRSADLDLGDVRTVDQVGVHRRNRTLVATPAGVRVMDAGPGCFWRWRLVAVAGKSDLPAPCLGEVDWYLEGVTYHPGQDAVYLSVIEDMQTDIGLTPLSAFAGGKR